MREEGEGEGKGRCVYVCGKQRERKSLKKEMYTETEVQRKI